MKLLVLSSVIAIALGAPEATAEADADAYYGQYQWPGAYAVGPYGGFSSTCYGCRLYGHYGHHLGKRSADADADADAYYGGLYGAYGHGGLYGGYGLGVGYAHGYGYGAGIAHHPAGHSYVAQSVQGLHGHYGKREAEPVADAAPDAEAEADAYYGHYGYGGYGLGVAHHAGLGHSYVGRTIYGYPRHGYGYGHGYGVYGHGGHFGKRSADAEPTAEADADAHYGAYGYAGYGYGLGGHAAYGYGLGGHAAYGYGLGGHATSYVGPTVYGYPSLHHGKRSADAEPTADADADAFYAAYGYGYGLPGGYTHVSGVSHHGPYAYGYGLGHGLGYGLGHGLGHGLGPYYG